MIVENRESISACRLTTTNTRKRFGSRAGRVLVQTAKGIGDNGIWRIAKLNGILYLPDVGSKTTSFSSAFAGIFASN